MRIHDEIELPQLFPALDERCKVRKKEGRIWDGMNWNGRTMKMQQGDLEDGGVFMPTELDLTSELRHSQVVAITVSSRKRRNGARRMDKGTAGNSWLERL